MFHYVPPADSAMQDFFTKFYPAEEGFGELKAADMTPAVYFCFLASNSASKSVRLEFSTHIKTLPVVKLFFTHLAL